MVLQYDGIGTHLYLRLLCPTSALMSQILIWAKRGFWLIYNLMESKIGLISDLVPNARCSQW